MGPAYQALSAERVGMLEIAHGLQCVVLLASVV